MILSVNSERLVNGKKAPTSYTYNAFGRLIKVEKDGKTVVYGYNPLGQRISRTVTDENGTRTEKYYYVGRNILDIATAKGTEKVISGLGVDEIYGVVTEDGSKHFFVNDYLGSVKMEFDEQGNIIKQRHYRAFGYEPSGSDDGFGFTSREYDSVAELYFYRSRYYDSRLGRFIKPDSFNETGLLLGNPEVIYNPVQLNDYVYVGNNPVNWTDPKGKFILFITGLVLGSVGAVLIDSGVYTLAGYGLASVGIGIEGYLFYDDLKSGMNNLSNYVQKTIFDKLKKYWHLDVLKDVDKELYDKLNGKKEKGSELTNQWIQKEISKQAKCE